MKWIIYELRIWNQVKLWSSQLWTQFLQLRREAWKIQDFNGRVMGGYGFKPRWSPEFFRLLYAIPQFIYASFHIPFIFKPSLIEHVLLVWMGYKTTAPIYMFYDGATLLQLIYFFSGTTWTARRSWKTRSFWSTRKICHIFSLFAHIREFKRRQRQSSTKTSLQNTALRYRKWFALFRLVHLVHS